MSDTPDPVSLKSLSLSGSDESLISDLFLRIDFDLLCVSFDPSAIESSQVRHFTENLTTWKACKSYISQRKLIKRKIAIDEDDVQSNIGSI